MRVSSLFGPPAAGVAGVSRLSLLLAAVHLPLASSSLFTPTPPLNLDLEPLGRIALAGDFDSISLYQYEEQRRSPAVNPASQSQSIIAPLPNGALAVLASADADILALCPLQDSDGKVNSIVVGGNFTSLGGIESPGMALFDPLSGDVTAVPGLSGQVTALLCDNDSGTVYVGGDFKKENTSNAIAWSKDSGFTPLPFDGFNKPVTSIAKIGNGHIVFGGSFDGLGNSSSPMQRDQQIINLQTAKISAGASSSTPGFDDPRNVICSNGQDGAGNTWLLPDHAPGFWRADMSFGFQPTKLRIRNTHQDGRGTKAFRFARLPDNGIMNMTYTDPDSGDKVACDAFCPLSDDPKEEYRDFHFVNVVGMNGFELTISDWYGPGAGFNSIELFEDDIYSYAVNDFNEPSCANLQFGSTASTTGDWTVTPSGQSAAEYLSAKVTASNQASTSVTFKPDIRQSGNYSVTVFTPGCLQDNTCSTRGIVNVTATLSSDALGPVQTLIYQTNNYDKYDQIYLGHVDENSDGFRATVNLGPADGQDSIDVVASRVRFELRSSTGGLNGLFEFDPASKTVDTQFSKSAINNAGTGLDGGASISSLVWTGNTLYAGGKFANSSSKSVLSFSDGSVSSLPDGGLNGAVDSMLVLDDVIFVGGNFSGTPKNQGDDKLKNVAAYSTSSKSWEPLGAGVDGRINYVVEFPLNVTEGKTETTIAVSGDFTHILPYDDNDPVPVSGFAVWVPSRKAWLENLKDVSQGAFHGQLTTSFVSGNMTFLAGDLASEGVSSSGAVSLTEDDDSLALDPLPVDIEKSEPLKTLQKRATTAQNVTGVIAGLFDTGSGRNLTILAGHFTAKATNGSTIGNLLFINGSNKDAVTGAGPGIDSESRIVSLAVQGDSLYAGGAITGTVSNLDVSGLILYDLAKARYSTNQPPQLEGDIVVVNSIAPQPDSADVYVGGQFKSAGSMACPSVCNYRSDSSQWVRPGDSLQGTVSVLKWATKEKLLAAGNLTVGGNQTMMASYDTKTQTWSSFNGASSANIPGAISAFCPARQDSSRFWVAGKNSDGSPFLSFYDSTQFRSVPKIFGDGTAIHGIQIIAVTENHADSEYLDNDQVLLVSGRLEIPDFGSASAAIYNGTTLTPFLLTMTADGEPGSIAELFTENENTLSSGHGGLSNGLIVLVSFCIALGLVFLLVAFGILFNRYQRHKQGYVRAPQGTDRKPDLTRVPPEYLLDSLRHRPGAPAI